MGRKPGGITLTLYSRSFLAFSRISDVSCGGSLAVEISLVPIISRCNLALLSSGVSVQLALLPLQIVWPWPLDPFPVLNFRFFSLVGSTRDVQSSLEGGTIIHSSLSLFPWANAEDPADTAEDEPVGISSFCGLSAGKPGPISSSLLLLSVSLSGGCRGRSSKLAGGSVGPIVRGFLVGEKEETDAEFDDDDDDDDGPETIWSPLSPSS